MMDRGQYALLRVSRLTEKIERLENLKRTTTNGNWQREDEKQLRSSKVALARWQKILGQ